ncbi:hypothetical protein CXF83_05450 [Shewanella sp. Choline-02u-19]|uniref:hypothetical protein n=1 Tax=unclassified Shewanella TaxID=196818 RepID=UPI000C3422C5|nr:MULTISPECIES: hypothetical protein [unclassified Shewanella]PKG55329.1 hypothetical protein CXF82_19965 [Shewanella sp. GutDb-MelDb]PKG76178.1 hypothetical protein CXF86_04540 [Shewanella sp. GutCb]PKH56294.1 hypothetical protein CXF84_14120 [Shewanella sp. Bg11-22]PKI30088.1 hypothetical protein CXF83_05450 [Shewanella sp. Choline-02u-19]
MAKVRVKQEESLSIKFLHQMEVGDNRRLDLYFFLPKEMGINSQSLNEDDYYHSSITGRRSYYSSGLHLPLVQSRFVSQKKRTVEEFRLYLNLFAYQFAVAIETDSKELSQVEDLEQFYVSLEELSEQVIHLLKRFRRNEPSDEKWKSYFENADNYLSWLCEQRLLKLLAHAPRSSDFNEITESVVALCRAESQYRDAHKYNSSKTIKDPNRIANKMHLLRRLIQQGVVLKEELKPLGVGLKKMTTGIATAMVMLVVSTLIIKAQGVFSGLTIALVLTLAVIYGFREIFKDDIRNALWRLIQRGRPRWSRLLQDTTSKLPIAKQLMWLDFMRKNELPIKVSEILKRRHSQNKVDAEILHYGIHTRVSAKGFLAGYSRIQEQVNFSLVPFARNLERGKAKIYKEHEGKISNESVERRYQVNLILVLKEGRDEPQYARYKITMNRSTIIEITESDLPSGMRNMDEAPYEDELLAPDAAAEHAETHPS